MKRLIVNADDFGLAPGINLAVIELNQAGALSSSTLMAVARYFPPAVHLAFAQTALGVGCHVVLVDGSPILPASEIPSLIDPGRPQSSCFRSSLSCLIRDLLLGRIREAEIEAEAIAQIRRIQSSGLTVTHLDTHKHTHMFPSVLRPLLRAAAQCGVEAVRNPFEPRWSLRVTAGASSLRRIQVLALRTLKTSFASLTRSHGIVTTDGAIGVLATGSLNLTTLRSLLRAMPHGTWELVCHPGYCDRTLEQSATSLKGSREIERSALHQVMPQAVEDDPSLALINFRELRLRL